QKGIQLFLGPDNSERPKPDDAVFRTADTGTEMLIAPGDVIGRFIVNIPAIFRVTQVGPDRIIEIVSRVVLPGKGNFRPAPGTSSIILRRLVSTVCDRQGAPTGTQNVLFFPNKGIECTA